VKECCSISSINWLKLKNEYRITRQNQDIASVSSFFFAIVHVQNFSKTRKVMSFFFAQHQHG